MTHDDTGPFALLVLYTNPAQCVTGFFQHLEEHLVWSGLVPRSRTPGLQRSSTTWREPHRGAAYAEWSAGGHRRYFAAGRGDDELGGGGRLPKPLARRRFLKAICR